MSSKSKEGAYRCGFDDRSKCFVEVEAGDLCKAFGNKVCFVSWWDSVFEFEYPFGVDSFAIGTRY